MGVTFLDSFGHYAFANVADKGILPRTTTYASNSIDATGSPTGGPCFKVTPSHATLTGSGGLIFPAVLATEMYAGGRFKFARLGGSTYGGYNGIIEFMARGTYHVAIVGLAGGAVCAIRAGYDDNYPQYGEWFGNINDPSYQHTLLGTSVALPLSLGVWAHVEAYVSVSDTVGIVKVWVNGSLVLDLSNVDTRLSTYTTISAVGMGHTYLTTAYGSAYLSDVYVGTTRQGDARVDPHFPDANGTDSTMARSTGSDDYALLDESQGNTTDYLSSDTIGQRTSINVEALRNAGGLIKAVQITAYLTKQKAGTAGVKPYVLRGGSRYYGDEMFPAWGSWQFFHYVWDVDPVTSVAWTEADYNSSEFGLERTT